MPTVVVTVKGAPPVADLLNKANLPWSSVRFWLRGLGSAMAGGAIAAFSNVGDDSPSHGGADWSIVGWTALSGAFIQGSTYLARAPSEIGGGGWGTGIIIAVAASIVSGVTSALIDPHLWHQAWQTNEWGPFLSAIKTGVGISMLGWITRKKEIPPPAPEPPKMTLPDPKLAPPESKPSVVAVPPPVVPSQGGWTLRKTEGDN